MKDMKHFFFLIHQHLARPKCCCCCYLLYLCVTPSLLKSSPPLSESIWPYLSSLFTRHIFLSHLFLLCVYSAAPRCRFQPFNTLLKSYSTVKGFHLFEENGEHLIVDGYSKKKRKNRTISIRYLLALLLLNFFLLLPSWFVQSTASSNFLTYLYILLNYGNLKGGKSCQY